MKYLFTLCFLVVSYSLIAQSGVSYIRMQRTACFGRCPEYVVELFRDGRVEYRGKKNVSRIGEYHAKLPAKTMNAFMKKISSYKLSSLPELYTTRAADLPRLHFMFVLNGKTKKIENATDGPAYLAVIGKKVDSLIETAHWESVTEDTASNEGPKLNIDVQKAENPNATEPYFTVVEQMPEFPGGQGALMTYLSNNIHYPDAAKENHIEGRVFISFIVGKQGEIEQVKVLRGIGSGCDEEAMRVVKMMPNWRPGKQNGMAVRTSFTLPVTFSLN